MYSNCTRQPFASGDQLPKAILGEVVCIQTDLDIACLYSQPMASNHRNAMYIHRNAIRMVDHKDV
eukprot:6184874-Pleurochrysis_carterae.AAC.5